MLDPLSPPPHFLVGAVQPFADRLNLTTLPEHIHEIVGAAFLYQFIQSVFSPAFSRIVFKRFYNGFNTRTRINWDVHVVSMIQSLLINGLALWVIFEDRERKDMTTWADRVYGYTGACGLIQSLAAGYFLWDLGVSVRYYRIFGPGILAHAITALSVYLFGFRPFSNYYGPIFILYELSTPFLNVHWFCDKLNLTGSRIQWFNGMFLLSTFFGCRLIWGTYQSFWFYMDLWKAVTTPIPASHSLSSAAAPLFVPRNGELCLGDITCIRAQAEIMKFAGPQTKPVPALMAVLSVACNLTLHALNFFWFGRMIETVTKRFQGKPHDEYKNERDRRPSLVEEAARGLEKDVLSGPEDEAVVVVTGREEANLSARKT